MSDIQYWKKEWTEKIIETCEYYFTNTYMFLSKNYESYLGFTWPENTMQGLTVESPGWQVAWNMIIAHSSFPRPYLSIEPIMGGVWYELPREIQLVIVGAETGNRKNRVIPEKKWIQSIRDHVPEEKIYWKKNIQEYL
jgi:protein gp37